MAIFAGPILLARSNQMIVVNLCLAFITVCGAATLLLSAADTPYQCFTSGGSYEDHTSGLEGFGLWFGVSVLLSYVFLLFDLAIWFSSVIRRARFGTGAFDPRDAEAMRRTNRE